MPMCACNTANAGLSNASDSTAMAYVEQKEENEHENNFKGWNSIQCVTVSRSSHRPRSSSNLFAFIILFIDF